MKLWILKPVNSEEGFWDPWYDKAFGFVVRAETQAEARDVAQANGWGEIHDHYGEEGQVTRPAWTDCKHSTCEELLPDGEPGLIMKDTHSA